MFPILTFGYKWLVYCKNKSLSETVLVMFPRVRLLCLDVVFADCVTATSYASIVSTNILL